MSRLVASQRAWLAPAWVREDLSRKAQALPSLDLRFADTKSLADAVTGQSLITFTRASSGTYVGSDRLIKTATTNLLLRSEDFSIGVVWPLSGSTLPTITANAGISPDGNATADLWTRTITGPSFISQAIAKAATTIQYTFSIFVKQSVGNFCALRVQGTYPARADVVFNIATGAISNAAAAFGGFTAASASIIPYPNNWYRLTFTATSDTATSYQCIASFNSNNTVIDGIDSASNSAGFLWGAQLEQSSTVGEYIPTASTINSAPRFDHNPTTGESLGLLVEEQRTNSIRNNTMVGAVAGTPGTLPTNWIGAGSSGLAREVIGTGTESGIAYVDVRYFGTTTSALFQNVSFEVTNQIAAAQSSIWTSTAFVKLVGGSLANITAARLVIDNYNSSNVALGQYAIGNFVPTTAALVTQRYSASSTSSTFSNAATAFVRPYIQFEANSGVAIDITLRIGLPQLEQGAFVTSVIPTTTAAATRSADVASITGTNFSSWYRQDEGTVFASSTVMSTSYANGVLWDVGAGGAFGTTAYGAWSGTQWTLNPNTASVNMFCAVTASAQSASAYALKTNDSSIAAAGLIGTQDTSCAMPASATTLSIGKAGWTAGNYFNGTIRRLTYWPQRLANSTLQAITQ